MKTKLLLLLIIFLSCKDVDLVTKENYNQIEMNMPQNQVIAILDEPKMRFSIVTALATVELWYYREDKKIIDICFLDYKVIGKRWRDLEINELESEVIEWTWETLFIQSSDLLEQ